MKQLLIITLLFVAMTGHAQKIKYTINNGLQIEGVDATNPVLYDNDMVQDTPDIFYLWLKANRKEVNLVGNVNTRDMHPDAMQKRSHDATFTVWTKFYNAYTANGMKNVPVPVKGSSRYFNASSLENSPGTDLIISEAKKASSVKPLVIIVGGQVTSIANAFLKDRSIGPNIIVMHVDGYGETGYNAIDDKACLELINGGVRYINWSGNLYSWYNKAGSPMYSGSNKMPGINLNGMPSNSFSNQLRNNWFNQAFAQWGDIGDAPPIFYFFNHSLWQNVVRKNVQKQTVTVDNFAYLLVSENKWNDYGPMLNSYVVNPTSYIPVTTTTPPVNNPPSVSIANTTTIVTEGPLTIMANASDSDGQITKVEFFVDAAKVGEDAIPPYDFTWSAAKGIYYISAKATDNSGAATISAAVVFTVNSTTTPPPTGTTVVVGTTTTLQPGSPATVVSTPTPTGIALNFGIPQGIPGPMGPQGPSGSGSGGGQILNYYNARDFGAKGDGVTDDTDAIQRWLDKTMSTHGYGTLPAPPVFYKITRTLNMGLNPSQQSYYWFTLQGSGQPGYSIVYMGPSGQPAIKMWGFKGGSIKDFRVKIGDGITNSACWSIGTMAGTSSNSTSGFTFYDCSVELNKGVNNAGFLIGDFGGSGDVSQIVWQNCTAWGGGGVSGNSISGQDGWRFNGNNALQFTWVGGSSSYAEHAVELNAGGAMYFWGFGGSQNRVDYYFNHSNTVAMTGNRWESGKQHIVTTPRASHMSITETGSTVADYMPDNGRLIELQQPGTLILDGLKIEKRREIGRPDFGSEMIYMNSSGMGSLHVRGGAFHAAEPFYTLKNPGTWSISIEGVGKMDANYNSTTQFQNK